METDFSNPAHWVHLFNSPLECGIRAIANLSASFPSEYDLQRLLHLDYLIVHSSDGSDGSKSSSIHPPTPYRFSELVVRRSFVDRGIKLMASRALVTPIYSKHGIRYRASEETIPFLDSLCSRYVDELQVASRVVAEKFSDFSDAQLTTWVHERMGNWGTEFGYFTLVRPEEAFN